MVCTQRLEDKSFAPAEDRTSVALSLVRHYIDELTRLVNKRKVNKIIYGWFKSVLKTVSAVNSRFMYTLLQSEIKLRDLWSTPDDVIYYRNTLSVIFKVVTIIEIMLFFRFVFWDVIPCKIIVDRRFRGTCWLHLQGDECTRRRENLKSHKVTLHFKSTTIQLLFHRHFYVRKVTISSDVSNTGILICYSNIQF
jgi:hypothetical protein